MSEESLQQRIDELPKVHPARHYSVVILDRRDNYLATRYVRATSKRRAELAGFKINRYTFGDKKSFRASAGRTPPNNWTAGDWS